MTPICHLPGSLPGRAVCYSAQIHGAPPSCLLWFASYGNNGSLPSPSASPTRCCCPLKKATGCHCGARGRPPPQEDPTATSIPLPKLPSVCYAPAASFARFASVSSCWYMSAHSGVTPYRPTSADRRELRVFPVSP